MPTGHPVRRTAAFSVEQIRAAVRGQAMVPANMLADALKKTHEKLNAKETKFFAHQGEVVNTREVEADSIQLAAARLILEMGELLTKNTLVKPAPPTTTREIDPKTGVIKLHIGEVPQADEPEIIDITPAVADPVPTYIDAAVGEVVSSDAEGDPTEYIKMPKGKMPKEVYDALFGEPKVGGE